MAKYLFEANYTQEGLKGVASAGGSARRDAIESMISALGGTVEAFYFAQGESDVVLILDLPDNKTVAAISLATGGAGAITNMKTRALLTPEEIDEAAKTAVDYRPPGS
jgi:uncharacterized protein with GYD domain